MLEYQKTTIKDSQICEFFFGLNSFECTFRLFSRVFYKIKRVWSQPKYKILHLKGSL